MRFLTRRHWIAFLGCITAAIVIAVSTACSALITQPAASQSTSPDLAQSASSAVTIQGFQFNPNALTVKLGSTVTFTNQDATPHTVAPEVGKNFTGTGRLQKNESKQVTFNQVGEQNYFCEIHPSMKGTVTVIN
jgi:plastocyanin